MYSAKKKFLIVEESSGSAGGVFLYVSFYLVILAFFILLNSIAHIEEEKKSASIGSVQTTFSGEVDSSLYKPMAKLSIKSSTGVGSKLVINNYVSKVKKIAKESVALIDAKMVEYGNNLKIEIPIKSFFNKESSEVKINKFRFLNEVIQEIMNKKNLSVEIVLPDYNTSSYPTISNNIFLKRSSSIIKQFLANRVDMSRVYVGISTNQKKDIIVLWFLDRTEKQGN